MNKVEIHEKLQIIFREVFENEELSISNETNANDIDEWDSLMHISLLVEIEAELSIKFEITEIDKMENIGQMIDIIDKKINY